MPILRKSLTDEMKHIAKNFPITDSFLFHYDFSHTCSSAIEDNFAFCSYAKKYLFELKNAQRYALDASFLVNKWIGHYCLQIDKILQGLFDLNCRYQNDLALIAVGGYGRGELFPKSDIDLLIICEDKTQEESIEHFVHSLWSLNLNISHSVRRVEETLEDAKTDIDMLTSLIEARYLAGNKELAKKINIFNHRPISAYDFLQIKLIEQHERDNKINHIGRLEPDIKTDPGSLRDIQMINWIYRYCLHPNEHFHDLRGLLTAKENSQLLHSREICWKIRFALHLLPQSHRDRLSFENQKVLAKIFEYRDGDNNLAVERFMRRYYLCTLRTRRLNRLAIKLIEARISTSTTIKTLDSNFVLKNNRLSLKTPIILQNRPSLILKIFLHLLDNPQIDGIAPQLARQLRQLRDGTFFQVKPKQELEIHQLFLKILNHPGDVSRQIRRMHRYNILGKYIPAFKYITGKVQFDLFHEYTVDQHSLRLIVCLDQFKQPSLQYPQAYEIMRNLRNKAILYLAGIFHDIGKGKKGDHCENGAKIIAEYASKNTAISIEDKNLLIFLVKNHLLLSDTAQKKDLTDDNVINEFKNKLPSKEYLDYLYLLTIADISATNSKLWNSWRAELLSNLYNLCVLRFKQEEKNQDNKNIKHIDEKEKSLDELSNFFDKTEIQNLWKKLPNVFFKNEKSDSISEKTRNIYMFLNEKNKNIKIKIINQYPTRIFALATISSDVLFAKLSHLFEKNRLPIAQARLYFLEDISIQEYTLSDDLLVENNLIEIIENQILDLDLKAKKINIQEYKLKDFLTNTKIKISNISQHQSLLSITCKDRTGLLSLISNLLIKQNISLTTAKIATYGEKVEDFFYISKNNSALSEADAQELTNYLYLVLNDLTN